MEAVKQHWKYIAVGIVALLIGTTMSSTEVVTEEVEKEVIKTEFVNQTPQACSDLIDLDDEIFLQVADALIVFTPEAFEEMTLFVENNTDKRLSLVAQCRS